MDKTDMTETPLDPYYSRGEVSNSDLTALKFSLNPRLNFVDEKSRKKAFHLGTLVDALVTEPDKCNHYTLTVDNEKYTQEEWTWGKKRLAALKKRAQKDAFLKYVLEHAEGQRFFVNENMPFCYHGFNFSLPVRCKFDWWLGDFGGDLKTTAATTMSQFESQIDFVDWDRSRVWYMNLVHSLNPDWGNCDFIYGVSKTTDRVFYKKIIRGDELFKRGERKALEWAFRAWTLM